MSKWRKAKRNRKSSPARNVTYPIGTVAYYGPDDQTVTKIVAGVIIGENAEPILQRWVGPEVLTNQSIGLAITIFFESHNVHQVAVTDGILGCPHEEGVDFPLGQECPYCPFWHGKQGIIIKK
jgi:hypothetical protein